MLHQIKYEWEIKDFSGLSKSKNSAIYSPVFIGSPDEIGHRWEICLKSDLNYLRTYGIYLHLDDKPFQQPISAKFSFQAYNMDNEVVSEKCFANYKFERNIGHGNPCALLRSKCLKSVKKICVDIELNREQPIKIQAIEPKPINANQMVPVQSKKSEPTDHQLTKKLQEDLLNLYESKKYTDFTVKCGDRDFDVHKNILVSRSPMFETTIEDNSKAIGIDDINPESMEVFLKFLYTGSIKITLTNMDDILELSKKFNLQDLNKICSFEMIKNIEVSNAVKFLIAADKYGMQEMKTNALQFIKENLCDVVETEAFKTYMKQHAELVIHLVTSIAKDGK